MTGDDTTLTFSISSGSRELSSCTARASFRLRFFSSSIHRSSEQHRRRRLRNAWPCSCPPTMPVSDTERVGPGVRAIRRGVSTSSISLLAAVFVAGVLPSDEAFLRAQSQKAVKPSGSRCVKCTHETLSGHAKSNPSKCSYSLGLNIFKTMVPVECIPARRA